MSSEVDDPGGGLQSRVQPAAPFGELAVAGSETARAPAPALVSPIGSAGHPGEPSESLAWSPDTASVTAVFCSNCEEDVEPGGKGHCPICGRFLPDNVAALVHGGRRLSLPPERASRRAALRTAVWADLGGTLPPVIAEVAEDFVSACVLRDQLVEYLEDVGALTQRGTRRAAMDLYLPTSARIERLSAMLGAFRTEVKANALLHRAPDHAARLPASALTLGKDLLTRLVAGETLTDFDLGRLDVLRTAMRGEVELPPDPRDVSISTTEVTPHA
jgi:hypothetical protein